MSTKYPEKFYDTSSNRQVSDDDIQQMIDNSISSLKRDNLETLSTHSGNVMVLVYKIHEEDGGGIHVIVSENYKELYLENKVLSK